MTEATAHGIGVDGAAWLGCRKSRELGNVCGDVQAHYVAAFQVSLVKRLLAVVVGQESNELGLGTRDKVRVGDHAVKSPGEDFCGATCGGGDGEMVGGVVEEFRIERGDVGDELAVGGPCGGHVEAGIGGDLGEANAVVWVVDVSWHNPDVGVVGL